MLQRGSVCKHQQDDGTKELLDVSTEGPSSGEFSWYELKYERAHVLYGNKARDTDKPIGMTQSKQIRMLFRCQRNSCLRVKVASSSGGL